MNYPLISEYIEAIKSAEDNFENLSYLRPVLSDDDLPVMTSGNFAVVFKMKDERNGKLYAVKCFTKEQEGRAEAYRDIAKQLKKVSSPYTLSIQYLESELFVDTDQTEETEFPVLLMEWVEGKTLDKFLRENLEDKFALEMLAYRFSQLAQWLIPQRFAHGDLKPENIIVREDGSLVLVDYDGMYVPSMYGQKARELGSPDFRHPNRTEDVFDEHIDDFPLLSILLSLYAISKEPKSLVEYGADDRLLFSEKDYLNIDNHPVISQLLMYNNPDINILVSIFLSLGHHEFCFTLPSFKEPYKKKLFGELWVEDYVLLSQESPKNYSSARSASIDIVINTLIQLDDLLGANGIDYILTGSLGLYMHGLIPNTYLPHDIDIIALGCDNPAYCVDEFFNFFEHYCGSHGPIYEDGTRTFVFYIGSYHIEVNAFFHGNNLSDPNSYREVFVGEHKIKLRDALCILKEKYRLCRLKDYQFNVDIQNTMNGYLHPQTNISDIKTNIYGYYTDPRDGYTYKTIKIGNQIWLAENLRYLPQIGNGYYVYDYHGNDVSEAKETQNYKDFGVLYNMPAAQEACPVGWHIPSDNEWKELDKYLGLPDFSEESMPFDIGRYFFRGDPGQYIEISPSGLIKDKTDEFGFNASLGGWKYDQGGFERLNIATKWWSNSYRSLQDAYYNGRYYINRTMCYDVYGIEYRLCSEKFCISLRCIKDDSLPNPEIPHKETVSFPYPTGKDLIKIIIKERFLQVLKDPYYTYLAIINSIVSEESAIGERIRPLWIPTEIDKYLKVNIETIYTNVKCTYYLNGVSSSFISECNPENIDDVVEFSYDLLNRLGLVGCFISDVSKAIHCINYNNLLNDRNDDLPF